MSERDGGIRASACGEISELAIRLNRAGRPWATFSLHTVGGSLPCVCFPRSFELIEPPLRNGNRVVVHGQPAVELGDFRVIQMVEVLDSRPRGDGSTA